jgi:hypothetical protein
MGKSGEKIVNHFGIVVSKTVQHIYKQNCGLWGTALTSLNRMFSLRNGGLGDCDDRFVHKELTWILCTTLINSVRSFLQLLESFNSSSGILVPAGHESANLP